MELSNVYLVSGRVSGDDDDTVHLVEASDEGMAQDRFERELRDESGDDNETIYINQLVALDEAMKARLKA